MKRLQWLLVSAVLPALGLAVTSTPAHAQLFFKKARPVAAQRVPELILTLKTETDERKRAAAAEELRDYDAKMFTEIVPVLIDALHNDKKSNVRLEALNSLSRLRPVTQPAGQAIEHAASSDESLRIRLQAKTALLKYHLAGYSSSSKGEPSAIQPTTQEPPLADPPAVAIPAVTFPPASGGKGTPAAQGGKVTPPAQAPNVPATPAGPALDLPRPLPPGTNVPAGKSAPPTIQIEGPSLQARPF